MQTKTRYALIFAVSVPMLALLVAPARFTASVWTGLTLFATAVLPALFPFLLFSKLLTSLGAAEDFSRALRRPMSCLYKTPPCSAYILAMSLICGYPVGARLTADFFESGNISEEDALRIAAFSSTSGPIFILGTVGGFLADARAGYIMLIAHYVGALANGLVYRLTLHAKAKRGKSKTSSVVSPALTRSLNVKSADEILSDAVNGAVISVAAVGAFIAVFSLIIDVFASVGIFRFVQNLVPEDGGRTLAALIVGFLEMTRGALEISYLPLSLPLKTALCSAVVAFGGLCVFLQAFLFLSRARVKASHFFLQKLTQALLTFLITYPLALLFLN